MKPSYLRTQLPISECRRRLDQRVGKPRWRLDLFGLGRYCDEPLQGSVTPDGFDIAETGPRGWEAYDPLVRGRWTQLGGDTIMRIQPYAKLSLWVSLVFGGVICAGALTFIVGAVAGAMTDLEVGACLLGFFATSTVLLLWSTSRRQSSLGREFARRLGVLFEAQPVEESEGRQLDMHFGV